MKWITVIGITVCVVLIFLYEWPKMDRNQKKEKAAFVILTTMGWLLAILLLFFPDMPGPTQMIDMLFKPLGKMLEK
ncbi:MULTISPECIES: hypothetical protein [Priestia]|jgi:hypothetical protein|uniref:Uncharacterized protein n=1 Tax=Priestia megaterium TaxID=1404 RepID=A0AAE5P5G8_PRIMG|nr:MULTISPECIES: hypothetical protein [Priestia]AVX07679.1 hypothetical protein CS527_08095 [Bacillus sp. Y-01]KRF53498.1 hypothetical protein ASG98_23710 [Bacillus sp. Soil531]MBZ5478865.1 hypothetical protein [Bacillus sp. T_4]MCF6795465.1 hypothetical protein [Bacillus sp. ET1]MDH6655465.1 multisubunit Na+/H+ antiporter MnhB subunit [Bacillus sp. PvP124]MDP9574387.1 multisubunit Na+/H+ antiporter MnhB subunit [Bacillus sp. 1751]RFB30415.1 hypothetical protein DZB87_08085 [Bacillus sp. ALD